MSKAILNWSTLNPSVTPLQFVSYCRLKWYYLLYKWHILSHDNNVADLHQIKWARREQQTTDISVHKCWKSSACKQRQEQRENFGQCSLREMKHPCNFFRQCGARWLCSLSALQYLLTPMSKSLIKQQTEWRNAPNRWMSLFKRVKPLYYWTAKGQGCVSVSWRCLLITKENVQMWILVSFVHIIEISISKVPPQFTWFKKD